MFGFCSLRCITAVLLISSSTSAELFAQSSMNPCPTVTIAEFPAGMDKTLCLFEVYRCPSALNGSMYADCDDLSSCSGSTCGSAFVPGNPLRVQDDVIISPLYPKDTRNNSKELKAHQKVIDYEPQDYMTAVPAGTAVMSVMSWATRPNFDIRYLMCVRIQTAAAQYDHYALYKICPEEISSTSGTIANDGWTDSPQDIYVGIRLDNTSIPDPATIPGGLTMVGLQDPTAWWSTYRWLPSNGSGYDYDEGTVKISVPLGNPETPTPVGKWFHLFGRNL